jgi:hypothetical protein
METGEKEKMKWILIISCAGILGYEAWALFNRTPGDTISEIIWDLSKRPLIPFVFGWLAGHFFGQAFNN